MLTLKGSVGQNRDGGQAILVLLAYFHCLNFNLAFSIYACWGFGPVSLIRKLFAVCTDTLQQVPRLILVQSRTDLAGM